MFNSIMKTTHRSAFILVEMIMILLIVAALFPIIHGFIFREVAKESRQLIADDEAHQIQFAQNTIERLSSEATQVDVAPDRLVFRSSRDVTTVRLKNKQIAQETGVVRYLTMLPVEVTGFAITAETPNRIRLTMQTRRKAYDWSLVR